MGSGDIWLAGIAGAAVGLSALVFLLTFSFFLGACVGGSLLFSKRGTMQTQIPFAPFLAIGTGVTLLLLLLSPAWFQFFLFPFA
jgi:leader peptidase (prepilin peptidase) / N-methyltransferase